MFARTLCNDVMSVEVGGSGDRTLVQVKDGVSARFWCDTADVRAVLRGFPLQLSAHEGYCHMRLEDDRVRLDFAVIGEGRKTCSFAAEDLQEALERIRQNTAHLAE